jgi:hypothetical protein
MMNVGMALLLPELRVPRAVTRTLAPMRRLATATILIALGPPAAAHAAQAETDRSCYLQTASTTVSVSGNGFGAGRPYDVRLDGQPMPGAAGTTDAGGAMKGAFNPPALAEGQRERTYQLAVASDDLTAATQFTLTRFSAGFEPSRGNPAKLRVRFSIYGFGLGADATRPDVYVHYVQPNGKLRTTLRLGRAQGACGSIPQTRQRKLFPFRQVTRGRWSLQFDTSKRYRKGTSRSSFLFYTVGVKIT